MMLLNYIKKTKNATALAMAWRLTPCMCLAEMDGNLAPQGNPGYLHICKITKEFSILMILPYTRL
jgi:hypothetical protein